jgi:hypothetical protein
MSKDKDKGISPVGQGFNDSRGEIPDKKDIPKHNGQNLNNDPAHHHSNEQAKTPPIPVKKDEKK